MVVAQLPGRSNSTNPYNSLLCQALEQAGATVREATFKEIFLERAPDILHIHWPEYCLTANSPALARLKMAKLFLHARVARMRGGKVVWTVHNLRPHERLYPQLETAFYKKWPKLVDGFVFLSESSRIAYNQQYPKTPKKPQAVIPHGDYFSMLSDKVDKTSARTELGLDRTLTIVGSFGAIRDYKNIPLLIKKFRDLNHPNCLLAVGGSCRSASLKAEIEAAAQESSNIRLNLEFLSDEDLEKWAKACDLLALPYSDIVNSGSALYALSCGVPALLPSLGSIPELQAQVGYQWIMTYDSKFTSEVLKNAISTASEQIEKPDLSPFSWKVIGQQTIAFYSSL
ncbi:MAG: glycosyltransferase [Armatimonadetes bacterium]|nr:glycosyltransferase [Armatimonadota bacterium]